MQSGPCLPHCYEPSRTLAAAVAVAFLVGALYHFGVRAAGLGTPFADSLSEAQRATLQESKRQRQIVFCMSCLTAAFFVLIVRRRL